MLGEFGAFGVAVAGDEVIVDHAHRLHEGVDDGRAAELESAAAEFLRHCLRHFGGGGYLSERSLAL